MNRRTPNRLAPSTTLDLKHQEQLKLFQEQRQNLVNLHQQLDTWLQEQRQLELKKADKTLGLTGYQRLQELGRLIQKTRANIDLIRTNQPEYDYFLKTGELIHQYHERKQQQRRSATRPDQNSLLQYFNIAQPNEPTNSQTEPTIIKKTSNRLKSESSDEDSYEDIVDSDDLEELDDQPNAPITKELINPTDTVKTHCVKQLDRADCNKQYLAKIDTNYLPDEDELDPTFCYNCNQFKNLDRNEAKMICLKCGAFHSEPIDADKPNYGREQSQDISNFAYKRINHFNEILNQCQATENTEIPQEIYDAIILEMYKEKCYNLADLDYARTRRYLKKYKERKYNKYYEHIPYIINCLNGIPPPKFTPIQEENLRNLFKQIQPAYDKYRPKKRSNFLSYYYTLYKLCELLGYDEFLRHLPLLKSQAKLRDQEIIWKNICKEMNYQFIPTV